MTQSYYVYKSGRIQRKDNTLEIVYKDGNKLRFTFYSNDPSCPGREISTKYVNLPEFNPRYNSDECKAYPNFSLCQMWTDTSFSNKQFENELANY